MRIALRVVPAGIFCAFCVVAQASDRQSGVPHAGFDMKSASLAPALSPGQARSEPLSIQVLPGDWGGAAREDVERLLIAVANELLVYFPERELNSILVLPSERHPLARYTKGPEGEYVVYLSAKGRHWSQYAYQFAHELAHLLSNYERNAHRLVQRNQWFEESLCETASLFTLRRLGATWLKGEAVPYAHWQPYGTALQTYAQDLIAQPHRALPSKSQLADWYRVNAEMLDKNPYLRERDELVAGMLLPLFEKHPEAWVTIGYLNLEESDATESFEQYLANWHRNTPAHHRPLVERIIELFGFSPRGS